MMRLIFFVLMFVFSPTWVLSEPRPRSCKSPGLLCTTCTTLVACIEEEEDTFIEEPIETCDSTLSCVAGECVGNTTEPFCSGLADLEFVCRKVGIFPDPFYCYKFAICAHDDDDNLVPSSTECEEGYQFNIETNLCDIPLEDNECEEGQYPVDLCYYAGQSAALEKKPAIFYVCEVYQGFLYPVLSSCPRNQVYSNYQCVDPEPVTPEPTTESTTFIPIDAFEIA